MSAYGQFEAGNSFCDSGQIVLFNAHSKDASDPNEYIVRVFKNTTGDSDQLSYFLSNSQAQANLTQENQAKHWAPIIEVGSIDSQGYSVQPKYELNLEDFIRNNKFSLTDVVLRNFVKGIVAGLIEAETLGPHGNLKPSNVLLEAPGKWSEAVVKLTDPHFHQSAKSRPKNDFKALARIIYFLVTGKEPASSLQRVSSEEIWLLQGGDASGWKDFCNELLADKGVLTLSDVQNLLDQVPTVSKQASLTTKVSIALLISCLLGIVLWIVVPPDEVEYVPEHNVAQWKTLVNAYDSWLKAVESSIEDAEAGDEKMQFWMTNKYLKETVLPWYQQELDRGVLIDPWLVIDRRVNPEDLLPPPKVLRRVRYLQRLETSHLFLVEFERKIKEWPALARLERISEEFKKFGLKGPADEITQMVEQFHQNFEKDSIYQLRLIHRAERDAKQLRDRCRQLLTISRALSKKGRASGGLPEDIVLTKLMNYTKNSWVEVNSLEALQDTVQSVSQKIKLIGEVVGSQSYREEMDLKLFREQLAVSQRDQTLSEEIIEAWLGEIPQYTRLSISENPLRTELWKQEEMKVKAVAAELLKVKDDLELEGGELKKVLRILGVIEEGQGAIFEKQSQIIQKPPIVKFSQELNSLNAQVLNQWDKLLQEAQQSLLEIRPDADKWQEKILADVIPNDEIVNREWIRRRDAILKATPRAQWESDTRVFGQLQRELRQLRTFLSGLSGEQMLSANTLPSQGIDGPVLKGLESFLEELREELFNDIFQELTSEVIEEMDVAEFIKAPEQQATLERYEKLKSEAALFGQDVRRVKIVLAKGGSYVGLPKAFWSKWRDHTVLKRVRNHSAIEPLVDQLEALEELYESPSIDPTELLALISSEDTPLANAILAWQKLGEAQSWPRTVSEFESELSALRTLLDREDMTLREMVIEEGRQRWLMRVESMKSNQELETAFRFLPEYRVKPSQLNPLMHFKYFIFSELSYWDNRSNLRFVEGDTVAQWKSELLMKIRENERWNNLDEAKILIEQLEAFQPDQMVSLQPATVGPGLKNWEVARGEIGDEAIAYKWYSPLSMRSYKIDFIKVEMPNLDILYMSRTEVSMGLFKDWVRQEFGWEQWYELISKLDSVHGFETRAGPRVWEVTERTIKIPEEGWLYPLPGWPDTLYFSGYQDGLPTENHPMQYIPPEFARKFALSLNCVLPTPAQWLEAHKNHTDRSPNRRDSSWMKQQSYVAANFNINHAWPDMDSFGPMVDRSIPTGIAATASTDLADDGKVWFSPVDDGASGSRFSHLAGNVAEYLYDESGFHVGGASALSAPSIEPSGVYSLAGVTPANGFSDVGIRLAFVVKPNLPGEEFTDILKSYYSEL